MCIYINGEENKDLNKNLAHSPVRQQVSNIFRSQVRKSGLLAADDLLFSGLKRSKQTVKQSAHYSCRTDRRSD